MSIFVLDRPSGSAFKVYNDGVNNLREQYVRREAICSDTEYNCLSFITDTPDIFLQKFISNECNDYEPELPTDWDYLILVLSLLSRGRCLSMSRQ